MSSVPISSHKDAFIGADALRRHARHLTRTYRIDDDTAEPLLEGRYGVEAFASGMTLRHAAVRNHRDMVSRAEMAPGLKLILLLNGSAEVRFGGTPLPLAPAASSALLINLCEAESFERRAAAGTRENSLTLTLHPEWLACAGEEVTTGLPAHLTPHRWQPSKALLELAREALTYCPASFPEQDDWSQRLRREGLALTLAGEGLGSLGHQRKGAGALPRHARRLWDFIESGSGDRLTLGEIARRLGMSVSTLQRLSHERHGHSLQRHLRHRRLLHAERELRSGNVDVSMAAELAGYGDPTNFATAFRRTFGISPREARPRRSSRG